MHIFNMQILLSIDFLLTVRYSGSIEQRTFDVLNLFSFISSIIGDTLLQP